MSDKHGKSDPKHTSQSLDAATKTMDRLATLALETAKKLGADAAKISTSVSFQQRLVVENKLFTLANSLESRGIGIVVHKDKKKGSASINTVAEDGVRRAVESALALAQYSVPDEALTLATREDAPPAKPLAFMYDEDLANVELPEIQTMMQEILGRLVRDPRVALDRYEMAVDASYHGMANSAGMRQAERQTVASWSFFGMARDGEEVTGFDYDGSTSYAHAGLLAKGMTDAGKFTDKILSMLNARQCPSYKGAVLFTPRAVGELLTGMILYHAGGRQVMDGKSRWEGSVGKKVLSNLLTLTDNPLDGRFSGATSFDGDGVPTRTQAIIQSGVLERHLHDCYSAKRCKAKTTATAGGPFSLEVAAGKTSLDSVLRGSKQLLVIDRFSGNSDPLKGDFSGVAKGSRLYLDGVDAGAVSETMVAGNFFEFADKILAVTDRQELVSGAYLSPYILVDSISVTGS